MNGAREYAQLFCDAEQHGRLLISSGSHARGKYFHVWAMPEGGVPNCYGHAPAGSVEVYGIKGGQPGWTEYYGWLHAGPWQADFATIVGKRRAEIAEQRALIAEEKAKAEAEKKAQIAATLATYGALK